MSTTQSKNGSIEIRSKKGALDERDRFDETVEERIVTKLQYGAGVKDTDADGLMAETAWAAKVELVWMPSEVLMDVREELEAQVWTDESLEDVVETFMVAVERVYNAWLTDDRADLVLKKEKAVKRFEEEFIEWDHICPTTWTLVDKYLTENEENLVAVRVAAENR
ncbi:MULTISPECIES: hypothetical protein [unclassified Haloferax]|jgi:hypothetical protein|uniref:hypothetical protein n=1 Tax=unclassified Haloferax TaxID=2625095 RepID=UPI0028759C1D|nr:MULTISPECIES: hypothetical protein [unclassified Haloferax]MDS0243071.1 hypothetical protein [Haloferax sp. S2CR25]MDS0446192.1 hypothetical protein [Haloferax sp. S2CR25-2]